MHCIDSFRRMAGRSLDRSYLRSPRCPTRLVQDRPAFVLRQYSLPVDAPAPSTLNASEAAILIIPAPIKSATIWDLSPDRSVVRAALGRNRRVYVLEWKRPTGRQGGWGLAQYADEFPADAVRAVVLSTNQQRVILFGHSLGGTLAAIYASLHPDDIAAMVLLESPLHFGSRDDAFAPLVAAMPACDLGRSMGTVPGTLLNVASGAAAPDVFQWRRTADLFASIYRWDNLLTHERVERWSLDEAPMAGKLFDDVVERLYRANEFMAGRLHLNGRLARPVDISVPVLSVYHPHSRLITADMVRVFHDALPNSRSTLIPCEGETGVALEHVGPLVGERAHRELWPRIFDWLEQLK